jgi:hypothetical protein
MLDLMIKSYSKGIFLFHEYEFPANEFPIEALMALHKGALPSKPLTESEIAALEGVLSRCVAEVTIDDSDLDCLRQQRD